MDEPPEFRRLKAIFDGDGTDIRQQFIYAGLLLTIFERFKVYVVDQVDGFFSEHIEIKDGVLNYTRGERFKQIIRESGSGEPGQHGNKAFRAALHWFYDLGAISKHEFGEVERIYALRNEIGHELLRIIADDTKNPIKLEDVLTTFSVYVKIVRWWIKEVEATTNPAFNQEEYDNADWDSVESSDTIFLREIIKKALVGDISWEDLETLARNE
jgi:hypothetical protein